MRFSCDCSTVLKSMTEDGKAVVQPRYDLDTEIIHETFNNNGDHFWMETWGVMEAKQLFLEMHWPMSTMKDLASKRSFSANTAGSRARSTA
jgi:hypothetical protein